MAALTCLTYTLAYGMEKAPITSSGYTPLDKDVVEVELAPEVIDLARKKHQILIENTKTRLTEIATLLQTLNANQEIRQAKRQALPSAQQSKI